ncbi:unnamed protein product [Parajaminaea phylloscopi]
MNYASPFSTRSSGRPALLARRTSQGHDATHDWVLASELDIDVKGVHAGSHELKVVPGELGQNHDRDHDPQPPSDRHYRPTPSADDPPRAPRSRWSQFKWLLKTQLKYIGPGITMSVAYCDPGNWSTDLQAGSQFGYPLLFIILLTGVFGILLQILSLRMGIVCDRDLAVLTRMWVLGLGKDRADKSHNAAAAAAAAAAADAAQAKAKAIVNPASAHASGNDAAPALSGKSLWAHRARHTLLWTLYLVAEGAIICTELAELVGSAIALNLLFPKLPLWAGVLITSLDVFLILFIYRPDTRSIRVFEACIGALVLVVISCLIALVVKVEPHWPDVFHGYLPSSAVIGPQALYVGIGILGATCMPHGLYLGSHFAMFEREREQERECKHDEHEHEYQRSASHVESIEGPPATTTRHRASSLLSTAQAHPPRRGIDGLRHWIARRLPGIDPVALGIDSEDSPASRAPVPRPGSRSDDDDGGVTLVRERDPRSLSRRIVHSTIDVTVSMLAFAITTNSALLIVAAQAFYFGIGEDVGSGGTVVVGDLFEAFELLKAKLNHASAILFAIALLAAGQSASITVTLAGQVISEGMINWRTNPFVRRCITRGITLVPSFAVAIAVGRGGLDKMLVASQVALSMALPFVLVPLLAITASTDWMRVSVAQPPGDAGEQQQQQRQRPPLRRRLCSWSWWMRHSERTLCSDEAPKQNARRDHEAADRGDADSSPAPSYWYVHFASSWPMVAVTAAIYVIVVLADGFVIVTTAMGTGGAA